MESIYKLGIILSVLDRVTDPSTRIGKSLQGLRGQAASLGPVFDKFKTYGLQVATFGAIMLHVLAGMAMASVPTQQALGELASVGVQDLAAVAQAGRKFSNQWSGTDQAQFVTAAYDIKSGISSLTDTGVAEYTRLAALTGKATKSTTAEMTSLFATGYGIYKNYYDKLSDLQFGQMFSAGLAASVQAFKTTGSDMAGAISNLGATATTANVPFEEQLAILGMLQATMSGNEAGTRYRAMIQAAADAGQKLKLQFMDANNQLLSLPQILTALRNKYGDTLDAMEKMEIQKAFGTQEAVMVIDLLYGSVDNLRRNIKGLSGAMGQGTLFTRNMAATMNRDLGAGLALLQQQTRNLIIIIGDQLAPALIPLFAAIGNGIVRLQEFAVKHKTLTRVLVISLAVIGTLAFALGTLAAAIGLTGLMWPNVVSGFTLLAKAAQWLYVGILTVIPAVWSFTAALLANPITWVVIAVAALVAGLMWLYKKFQAVRKVLNPYLFALGFLAGVYVRLSKAVLRFVTVPLRLMIDGFIFLYKHLDDIRQMFGPLISLLGSVASAVLGPFERMVDWLSSLNLFESGQKMIKTMVDGIASVIDLPEKLIRVGLEKIRNLLPFSDAKEGPLSDLTLSGTRILQTLGAGVQAAAPGFRRQVTAALGGAALATSVAVTPVMSGPGFGLQQAEAPTGKRAATAKTYKIHIERIELPRVNDGRSFIHELEMLVEGYDG